MVDESSVVSVNRKYAFAVYVLQALFFLGLFFTPIMGLILNYIKQEDVQGTLLESHFRWQKATFWYGLLWLFLSSVLILFIGWLIALFAMIWYFYRIAKGWIYLVDGKKMYQNM